MSNGAFLNKWREQLELEKNMKMQNVEASFAAELTKSPINKERLHQDLQIALTKIEDETRKALELFSQVEAIAAEWNEKEEIAAANAKIVAANANKEAILKETESRANIKAREVLYGFRNLEVAITDDNAVAGG
ncbi:uncharacterized protein LOC131884686 [Tigriopus californicus]|uniref:uncharacterized protein LOC131884686 n=1 Tax=Tigriopus californicus TaxID=6832 RepID=UPI0027D9DA9E|nr:uncharacterized protein LOC131884686 [Tigriopus californicus]